MNMIQKLSTKLQVHLSVPGVEKLKKVTFSNVVDNPEEAEIIQLGEIMTELDQDGTLLEWRDHHQPIASDTKLGGNLDEKTCIDL
jgi:hypothetical protein